MLRVLKHAFKTGVVTNKFPAVNTEPPSGFQGKPVLDFAACADGARCADACPTGALSVEIKPPEPGTGKTTSELTLDYGKCIYCGECMIASPECITIARELPSPSGNKESLVSRALYLVNKGKEWEYIETSVKNPAVDEKTSKNASFDLEGKSLSEAIHKTFGRSLHIRQVDAGSCNGCEIEITALNNPVYDLERFGVHFVASPRHADMLLVTGPVTRNMAIALRQTYDATPDPKLVIAVGACGISGGIFGESYASLGGVDNVVPVDVYIPGCPPGPEALLRGILMAIKRWPKQA